MVSVWTLLKQMEREATSWGPMVYEMDDQFHM